MKDLTDRQRKIFDYIEMCVERDGYPPTIREIALYMGISSPNGVNDHLKALMRKGYLERRDQKSRGIHLKKRSAPRKKRRPDVVKVPLVGQVAAGTPILAEENLEGHYAFDPDLVGRHGDLFALKVRGDSMVEAGIFDGDMVFVRPQSNAENGEIVVAMVDGEATVKRFQQKGNKITLIPEHPTMEPFEYDLSDGVEVCILGKVVHSLRSF